MANEIRATYDTGSTLYVLVFNAAGQVWKTTTNEWIAYAAAGHDSGFYHIALSEIATATGQYRGTFDADIAAGVYLVVVYLQSGGSPYNEDVRIGETGTMYWDGSAEVDHATMETILDTIAADVVNIDGIIPEAAGVAPTANEIRDAILDDATRFSGADIAAILTDVTGINGDAMRGTDSAATETKQDIIDGIVDELKVAVITNAAGVDIAADIIALKAETASILDDTDLIDDGTNGLAAIKAEVEGIGGITPATAANVATALSNYDGPTKAEMDTAHALLATEAKQDILDTNVDTLLTRLSSARAGYLDELAAANIPADVDTLLTRLSAARAGYLDELAAANLPADIDAIKGYTDQVEGYTDTLETSVATILAKTNLITAGNVSVTSPLSADNDLTIVQGDDYEEDDGTEISWTSSSWTIPSLSGATATLSFVTKANYDAGVNTSVLEVNPSITWSVSGDDAVFKAELTAAQTAALASPTPPNDKYSYVYHLYVTTGDSRVITIAIGNVHLKQKVA